MRGTMFAPAQHTELTLTIIRTGSDFEVRTIGDRFYAGKGHGLEAALDELSRIMYKRRSVLSRVHAADLSDSARAELKSLEELLGTDNADHS